MMFILMHCRMAIRTLHLARKLVFFYVFKYGNIKSFSIGRNSMTRAASLAMIIKYVNIGRIFVTRNFFV